MTQGSQYSNYARWKGGAGTRDSKRKIAQEIVRKMETFAITWRTSKMIRHKISNLEQIYRETGLEFSIGLIAPIK